MRDVNARARLPIAVFVLACRQSSWMSGSSYALSLTLYGSDNRSDP